MELDAFEVWLTQRGYDMPFSLETHRCKKHGYRTSGVFHYPTVEDSHTYYSCIHCLRETFETNSDAIPPQTDIQHSNFTPVRLSDDVIEQASREMEDWPW